MVTMRLRPIDRWPREQTVNRQSSPFLRPNEQDASGRWKGRREVPYGRTLADLERELTALSVREFVLQLAVSERDVRLDGELRADAHPRHPGVIVTFTAPKKGVLTFACDRFTNWQTNLRAIVKGLEALRLVDRYGITSSGEQYVGWQELPSGQPMAQRQDLAELSLEQASRIVVGAISGPHDLTVNARTAVEDADYRRYAYRQALKLVHPDKGGDAEKFMLLERAMKVLGANDDGEELDATTG